MPSQNPSAAAAPVSTSASSSPVPPAPSSASLAPSSSTASKHKNPPKPTNLFSNDGSFLERFQKLKQEENDKKNAESVAVNKRTFEDRFKKRGKRPAASSADGATASSDSTEPSKKKPKTEKVLSQYEKEVQGYESRSLKDQGIGVRPLVK